MKMFRPVVVYVFAVVVGVSLMFNWPLYADDELISDWRFDEGSATTAFDDWVSGNDGKYNSALNFDGTFQ